MSLGIELLEALNQFKTITWDGDLISKYKRDLLCRQGLVTRTKDGWNLITKDGVDVLVLESGLWPKNTNRSIDSITQPEMLELAKLIYGDSFDETNSMTALYQANMTAQFIERLNSTPMNFKQATEIYKYLLSINITI